MPEKSHTFILRRKEEEEEEEREVEEEDGLGFLSSLFCRLRSSTSREERKRKNSDLKREKVYGRR